MASALAALADPDRAREMAAYMKTEMPFYGVASGPRRELAREAKRRFPIAGQSAYKRAIGALWRRPHREEKYVAIALARLHGSFVGPESLPLYERLIREGAWWDFVDEIAQHLVGSALLKDPEAVWPTLDRWIDDPDPWIRRTALLCQNRHKERTDEERLFRYCRARAHEQEFFIRKAIGWALRQYSYTAPAAVRWFLETYRDELSSLSFREAARQLGRSGVPTPGDSRSDAGQSRRSSMRS
ncbi:MAG: DNA alkylation repair protein [bacterium]|nr:DNA alkylation repair protein [bacterium]